MCWSVYYMQANIVLLEGINKEGFENVLGKQEYT
jgi:hypothetical protein